MSNRALWIMEQFDWIHQQTVRGPGWPRYHEFARRRSFVGKVLKEEPGTGAGRCGPHPVSGD
jgi:hypothetical protein